MGKYDQLTMDEYIKNKQCVTFSRCSECICNCCLYGQSQRCPNGRCYDDYRSKTNPYDKSHPDDPPRTEWSNWKTDQSYWCRGGIFYPVSYCKDFVKYEDCAAKECINANVTVFQDGYIRCSLVDTVGCELCYERFIEKQI